MTGLIEAAREVLRRARSAISIDLPTGEIIKHFSLDCSRMREIRNPKTSPAA